MRDNEEIKLEFVNEEPESNSLMSVAQSLMPKDFAKKYKALKKAQEELEQIESSFKDKLKAMFESIPELETNSVVVDGIRFTYVGQSKRKSVDTKKLQEEHPDIYKRMLKETDVKSSIRTSIEW